MKLLLCVLCTTLAFGQVPKARSVLNTVVIRQGGSYLGVAVVEVDSDRAKALKLREERGVEVKIVDEGSPAAKAGLKPDDVVLEFNGQHIEGTAQFVRMVSETPVGRKATLGIVRGGSSVVLTAVLEPRPGLQTPLAPMAPLPPTVMIPDLPRAHMLWRTAELGIETESLNSQLAEYFGVKEGVLVRMVSRGSAAERAGLKAGDVIVKAGGNAVTSTRDVSSLLKPGSTIALGVVRNRKDLAIDVLLN